MATEPVLGRARRIWQGLAGAPVQFGALGLDVVVAPDSLLCPPGWSGVVVLGDAAIATAPTEEDAEVVRRVCGSLPVGSMTGGRTLRDRLSPAEMRGPATLAFCDDDGFRRADGDRAAAEGIPGDHPDLRTFLGAVPPDDADESGLAEITSPAFVVRIGGSVVAAAGYQRWPGDAAHLGVLTSPGHRERGLARVAASAAVADALAVGLLPQWRARSEPSRRVARALGFERLGAQVSFRLAARPVPED